MSSTGDEISELCRLLAGIANDLPDERGKNPDIPSKRLVELDPVRADLEAQRWADIRGQYLCKAYHRHALPEKVEVSKISADHCASIIYSLVMAGAKRPVNNRCKDHNQLEKSWETVFGIEDL